ncbi:MAG: hypothetical protein HZB92_00275 [Euryarchaeota archaeon]|nr:hypothetical protein [Euryarchaeota archaeon]
MALKPLFPLWISALVAASTILTSLIVYLLTGFIFILFIMPVPFLLFKWEKGDKDM